MNCDLFPRDQEFWRPVVGSEGEYEVSSIGRVRSLDRIIHRIDGVKTNRKGQILKPVPIGVSGYLTVSLGLNNRRYVHHLVLEAFLGPRPPGKETLHENDLHNDNWIGNLRWGTHKENMDDALLNGGRGIGEDHNRARLTEAEACRIKYGGEIGVEVARCLAVTPQLVCHIRKGRRWKHI